MGGVVSECEVAAGFCALHTCAFLILVPISPLIHTFSHEPRIIKPEFARNAALLYPVLAVPVRVQALMSNERNRHVLLSLLFPTADADPLSASLFFSRAVLQPSMRAWVRRRRGRLPLYEQSARLRRPSLDALRHCCTYPLVHHGDDTVRLAAPMQLAAGEGPEHRFRQLYGVLSRLRFSRTLSPYCLRYFYNNKTLKIGVALEAGAAGRGPVVGVRGGSVSSSESVGRRRGSRAASG